MTSRKNTDEQTEIPVQPSVESSDGVDSATVEAAAEQTESRPAEGSPEFYEQELAKLRKESSDNHDRYLRALADLENFRRRTAREKEDIRKYALGSFFEDFISILDSLYLGMDAASKHTEAQGMLDGFNMVFEQLKSLLGQHGLEEVNPQGQEFDPNFHDCFAQQPSDVVAEGAVLQVIRRGYSLNGRLLRPASVIVSSGAAEQSQAGAETENNGQ